MPERTVSEPGRGALQGDIQVPSSTGTQKVRVGDPRVRTACLHMHK